MSTHITLISQYAFYPMHWEAFRLLCTDYGARGSVIACGLPELPAVHRQLGWVGVEEARSELFRPDIRQMPRLNRWRRRGWLFEQLDELRPDAIWVQEEPTSRVLLDVLSHFRHQRPPRIICAVAENIFRLRWWRHWSAPKLWKRLDRLIAVATPSIEGIRRVGMPSSVPADTLVAGAQRPPPGLSPMSLPWKRQAADWVAGFAGRICEEKGWNVLLDAIQLLPPEFKVALAGSGPQVDELRHRLASSALAARAWYAGLLPKSRLWSFYRSLDCLVTPHRTCPRWKEQFGGVLADAMAIGLPIVGSDSGAIPEVVGPAGLIVPENNTRELAAAIRRLRDTPDLAARLSGQGQARFEQEFAIPAYASKIATALQLERGGALECGDSSPLSSRTRRISSCDTRISFLADTDPQRR